jgi:hypothetical protein
MNARNMIHWAYAISVAAFCLALYSKIANSEGIFTFFLITLVSQWLFAFFAIYELRGSEYFTQKEKANWTTLLLCAPLIFGTVYLVKLRRRIFFS